ncbi:hypothetical protein UlMin_005441 [Ulmus minor]
MFASWTTEGISLGKTSGNLYTETLESHAADFLVGCSNASDHLPLGHVGFGSGRLSVPSQMDDTSFHTNIIFDDTTKFNGLSYTSLIPSPVNYPYTHYWGFHYLNLQEILVGNKHVKIPVSQQLPGRDGNGGTIIGTSIPFTFLERSIFEAVTREFMDQMDGFVRAPDQGVLTPCFSRAGRDINGLPRLSFVFGGGAKMVFPRKNYFLLDDKINVVCLSLTKDVIGDVGPNIGLSGGPVVIMGNYLLMDFFFEFDLLNSTLGFKHENCD